MKRSAFVSLLLSPDYSMCAGRSLLRLWRLFCSFFTRVVGLDFSSQLDGALDLLSAWNIVASNTSGQVLLQESACEVVFRNIAETHIYIHLDLANTLTMLRVVRCHASFSYCQRPLTSSVGSRSQHPGEQHRF